MNKQELRDKVRKKYAQAITARTGCGCGDSTCCGGADKNAAAMITGNLYSAGDVAGLPENLLKLSLGCGNPTAMGSLHPGETVLDLGSGAGLDVLLSARRVGPYGKAYGLDMTDEMLAEANANKVRSGIANAEFLKGTIESIPLPESSVDVVISNCVINLSVDKDQVFREIFRVLRPGGRIAVSDIVLTRPLPEDVRASLLAWAGCVAGALTDEEYRSNLKAAGFDDIGLEVTRIYDMTGETGRKWLPDATAEQLADINGSMVSAFVRAKRPPRHLLPAVDFQLRPAEPADDSAMHALLAASGLPTEGVAAVSAAYWVADRNGVIGMAGYEPYGKSALLRSLAVAPQHRKAGLAEALVDKILQEAADHGVTNVYLLTETAAGYFSRRGFAYIRRDEIPQEILATSSLGHACPSSSQCMKLAL